MNSHTFTSLQYDTIKEQVATYALTQAAKDLINKLTPSTHVKQIRSWLDEVTEAVAIMNISTSVPIHGLEGIGSILETLNKGVVLRVDQLTKLSEFLDCIGKMRRFMKDKQYVAPRVASYVEAMEELPELHQELMRAIRHGQIDDYASKELLKVRKQIVIQEERLKEKAQQMVRSAKLKPYLQDHVVSIRSGRYVVPVKKEYRHKVKGAVLDTSASGSTLFIEPDDLTLTQDQLLWLKADEEVEIEKVLSYLTGLVEKHEAPILLAVETMIHYDVLFAKAKYSRSIDGRSVEVNDTHLIRLFQAKHPLLGDKAVPLTLELGETTHALVITGPNTGGKTVVMKTVGLLTLMAQTGLHIPVAEGSEISVFHQLLVDIGDGQSITDNLSTFSSRMVNIIEMLKIANDHSLVLLDELGSGTDPAEGMGLATAILEQLSKKGVTMLATTHYSEIKEFAEATEGFLNGSMEFNLDTLKPTYRLVIGKSGDSQAFAIALKLGMHPQIIERAHQVTYKEEKSYPKTHAIDKEQEKQIIVNKHQSRGKKKVQPASHIPIYQMGDNVRIHATDEMGIVYQGPDQQGNYLVQVKGEKRQINYKRLTLYIAASELYPADYDFDIIFETKENRKKDKQLTKRHVEGIIIERSE